MPIYSCKVRTPQGQIVKSRIDEKTRLACIKKLKRNGMTPISVVELKNIKLSKNATLHDIAQVDKSAELAKKNHSQLKKRKVEGNVIKQLEKNKKTKLNKFTDLLKSDISIGRISIPSRDIRVFTQNFYLLKKANFNNIHALSTVIETTENLNLRMIIQDILAGVENGEFMYTTMEYYQDVFPYIYINIIKVGELSGTLDISLRQAIEYLDNSDKLGRKIKRILIPNISMFVGLILLTIISVLFGVPELKGIFESIGSNEELPKITMAVYNFTVAFKKVWFIPVGIIVIGLVLFFSSIKTSRGRYEFDKFKYEMPIFGKLTYLLDFSRFMQGVLLNLKNGMRIQDSLEVSKNIIKNVVFLSVVEVAISNIYIGKSWIEPFEDLGYGDEMCYEMLRIGMQTDLPEMIAKLLEYIESDIDNTLEKIIKILPEISYTFVGIVLIFFVCAVLIPCINMYMGGWLFSAYDV